VCLRVYRWASAGAFYPFSRNHYTYFARPHEYYRWPDVAESAKKAYGLRYRLLTYIYSNLYLAHTRGGPVAKPVLFTDPADVKARCVVVQQRACAGGLVLGGLCWGGHP
jgi:alpha-glucosidase (family GH31 glycosyl hydrolase)